MCFQIATESFLCTLSAPITLATPENDPLKIVPDFASPSKINFLNDTACLQLFLFSATAPGDFSLSIEICDSKRAS